MNLQPSHIASLFSSPLRLLKPERAKRTTFTAYSYFGARYYDSDLSVWLSVDPMSDKYPSTSGYMYVLGRPTALIDPNGMNSWVPSTSEGGAWTAEAGDGAWDLYTHPNNTASWDEVKGAVRGMNEARGESREFMVHPGDQVTLQGGGASESGSASASESATTSNYNNTPSAGTVESVSVIGVLGDITLDVIEFGLQELGMSERAAENTTNLASLGMMIITKKPRIRGTNMKTPSALDKALSYDRPNNYIPGPLYPNKGGGNDNWIWWTASAGFAGGVAYYRIKQQQSQLDATPMVQPLPQDNTRVQPIIRPYYGR